MGGHGPDAWRVTGVSSDDVLNLRMGPGTSYPIIGSLAHDATGLTMTTCVPFMTEAQGHVADPGGARAPDPAAARWCLMSDAEFRRQGWVAGAVPRGGFGRT